MWVVHLEDDAEKDTPRNEGEEDVLQVDPTSPFMLAKILTSTTTFSMCSETLTTISFLEMVRLNKS
jgi:hypothetical protein